MEINMAEYVYLTGVPTSGGGIDYYYNPNKETILANRGAWEKGHNELDKRQKRNFGTN